MTAQALEVMVVSADRAQLRQLSRFLSDHGYRSVCCTRLDAALACLRTRRCAFLMLDEAVAHESLEELAAWRAESVELDVHVLLVRGPGQPLDLLEAYAAGIDDVLRYPFSAGETLTRLRAGARFVEYERRRAAQRWEDPLTGLATRSALLARLRTLLAEPSSAATLLLLDVDFFGRVNDAWGFRGGDEVLGQIARALQQEVSEPACVARLGANRFAVAVDIELTEAEELAEQLRLHIAAVAGPASERPLGLTASAGIAAALTGEDTAERLLERATRALDEARASGRDCVVAHGQFEEERRQWSEKATAKKSLAASVARDLMTPLTCVLRSSDSLDEARSRLAETRLPAVPVVDGHGRYTALATPARITDALRQSPGSERLEHARLAEVPAVSEQATFVEIIEQFMPPDVERLVVTRDGQPSGLIERTTFLALLKPVPADLFRDDATACGGTDALVVPDAVAP